MTEIGFYHLTRSTLDDALPRLIEKVVESGKPALIQAGSSERVEWLNRLLWTYRTDSFIPHGAKGDGHAAHQPVYLSADPNDRPNNPEIIVCVDGAEHGDLDGIERCLDMFDGDDSTAREQARARWKKAKSAGHKLVYWQQNERGGWTRAN